MNIHSSSFHDSGKSETTQMPLTMGCTNAFWYIKIMEHYAAIMWMAFINIMLGKWSQTQIIHAFWFLLYKSKKKNHEKQNYIVSEMCT